MRKRQCACIVPILIVCVQCDSASAPERGGSPDGSAPEIISPPGRIAFVADGSPLNGLYIANSDGSGLRKLASGPELYSRPRWSPDRRRILFGRIADGPSEIYVIDVDGTGGRVRLADGINPAWSPDGTKIVFASNGGAPLGAAFGIYVMNADGSGIRQLTSPPNNGVQCSEGASVDDLNPDWSPDGRAIVFERDFTIDEAGGYHCVLDGYARVTNVYVMNADGTEVRRLRPVDLRDTDADPAWSPDGLSVAFSKVGGLFVIGADGSAGQKALATVYPAFRPTWSADGKNLLFLAIAPTKNFVGIYELASGTTRFLGIPAAIGSVFDPAWSR